MRILNVSLLCVLINPSQAKKGFGPGEQDWGYVTVRPGAHMFWWLYYTTANDTSRYEEKPLIIWLQGGPGVSGTGYGNFEEFGPLDTDLKFRNHTWVKDYNVLIIDNPVGTGFSHVKSGAALVSNNKQIAEDLMTFMHSFFSLHPEFAETPTYILAESYGGKMTVEFAYSWYKEQVQGRIKGNLKGIGLIDSLISSNDMYTSMGPYLYHLGMIDDVCLERINEAAEGFVNASSEDDWPSAYRHASEVHRLINECTSGVDLYNVLKRVEPGHVSLDQSQHSPGSLVTDVPTLKFSYSEKLKKVMKMVKRKLNLTTDWGTQEYLVNQALSMDSRKPVIEFVEKLLNETRIQVFVINGQLDLIINTLGNECTVTPELFDFYRFKRVSFSYEPFPELKSKIHGAQFFVFHDLSGSSSRSDYRVNSKTGVVSWIKNMDWANSSDWMHSPMKPLLVDNIIEGYSKTSGRLTLYSVLRSGHMVPADNPQAMKSILRNLIEE